jgi:hypothetical protein
VKLIHLGLNPRFDMCVVFMVNYFFSGRQCPVDSEAILMIDFVNLNIKSAQSFKYVYRGKVYVRIFIEVNARMYINICLYCVS